MILKPLFLNVPVNHKLLEPRGPAASSTDCGLAAAAMDTILAWDAWAQPECNRRTFPHKGSKQKHDRPSRGQQSGDTSA